MNIDKQIKELEKPCFKWTRYRTCFPSDKFVGQDKWQLGPQNQTPDSYPYEFLKQIS